jgi:pyrroline-5-carboxylate reductase
MLEKVSFLGAGNIAKAIMGGMLKQGIPAENLFAADPSPDQLAKLAPGITGFADNLAAIELADVVVIAVKPNTVAQLCTALAPNIGNRLVISVAAGIQCKTLQSGLGEGVPIIRCMPNTPALVQAGMTGLFATSNVTVAQKQSAENILSAIGLVEWFENENDLDAVTAVSGSGPAYFFLIIEAMEAAAVKLGLAPAVAHQLVIQTALGASLMARDTDQPISELRKNVTSPGGTTAAAINSLINDQVPEIFSNAINAAHIRSIELAEE